MSFISTEDYQELIEDIVRDGRLYASENHQEILKVSSYLSRQEVSHKLPMYAFQTPTLWGAKTAPPFPMI